MTFAHKQGDDEVDNNNKDENEDTVVNTISQIFNSLKNKPEKLNSDFISTLHCKIINNILRSEITFLIVYVVFISNTFTNFYCMQRISQKIKQIYLLFHTLHLMYLYIQHEVCDLESFLLWSDSNHPVNIETNF